MATESEKKALVKKITIIDTEDAGYCSDCEFTWCINRNKILYCSLKYRGIRGYICLNDSCSTE